MIEALNNSPLLPYIQLFIVAVYYFILWLLLRARGFDTPAEEAPTVEKDLRPEPESGAIELGPYGEKFILNPETGKTGFANVYNNKPI